MHIKELNSKKLYKEYSLEIPFDEVDDSINAKIREIIPTVALPGFRKGKAPLNIVKKKYENNILNEVLGNIIQEKTKQLLNEKKLVAFRQPKVEVKKYKRNEPIEIIFKIDLKPEMNIFPFNKIKTTDYNIDIDERTAEENYKSFLNSQKKYLKLNNDRKIKYTDKVFVNIKTNDDSVPEHIKYQESIPIITDSNYQVLPDISNRLIKKNAKVGDIFKLKFDLKDLLKKDKEKNVEFEIKILSIEESVKFEVNKEFLEKNNFKSEKELKNNLNKNLSHQYETYLREIEKKQLMDILESKNNFDIPEGMLEDEFNSIWHKVKHAKKDDKLDEDDKKLTEIKLKERYRGIALRRVKLAILLQNISSEQNITAKEKELTDGMLNYASQFPGQEKKIFDYFKQNPASLESIRGPIIEKKVVDYIVSKTKKETKKISVKEFKKLQEDTFNYNKEKK
jgi:trigger factor